MRMWDINPKFMCDKHLLGEHVEMHMFVGAINHGKNIDGYINNGLVEINKLRERHDDISKEMLNRGMKHQSALPSYIWDGPNGKVDKINNIIELHRRCISCDAMYRLES